MKIKFTLILLFLNFGLAKAGVKEVGNGGDSIHFLFENGRQDAISRINKLRDCSFGNNVSADVKEWILKNKTLLASDIEQSIHNWISSDQPTCAWTELSSKASISLSYKHCDQNLPIQEIGKLLIHESTHHFGIDSEQFANAVAIATYQAIPGKFCLNGQLPEEIKWTARDKVKKLLPTNDKNGNGNYFGFDKENGNDCTVFSQYGFIQNAGPERVSIESFNVMVLEGHVSGSGSGLIFQVLANIENSPYPVNYIYSLEDKLGIFSTDNLWVGSRSNLQIDYRNLDAIEVTISNIFNPMKQFSKTCVIGN